MWCVLILFFKFRFKDIEKIKNAKIWHTFMGFKRRIEIYHCFSDTGCGRFCWHVFGHYSKSIGLNFASLNPVENWNDFAPKHNDLENIRCQYEVRTLIIGCSACYCSKEAHVFTTCRLNIVWLSRIANSFNWNISI